MNFESYFSRLQIIKLLCNLRAKHAKKVHDLHFHSNVSRAAKSPHFNQNEIYDFFPSRKEWIRLKKQERHQRKLSTVETNVIQLERTIKKFTSKFKKEKPSKWFIKLENFIEEVRHKALQDENYIIPNPQIISAEKDKKNCIYRPITLFDLQEKIIISQTAKYFIDLFDVLFEDCSYAFRSNRRHSKKHYTHHQAIIDIITFKRNFKGKDLWVAESDLQKFYDTVNHIVVKKALEDKIKEFNEKYPTNKLDERAIRFFDLYLNSYTFNKHVQTLGKNFWKSKKGKFEWVKHSEIENVGSNPFYDCIGVPQGGALSCFIANLVLDSVDKQVLEKNISNDPELFYARFCDDMVIIHPDRQKCQEALDRYNCALTEIKLISHTPKEIKKYTKDFWTAKSKKPYKWADKKMQEGNVPWLSFVGYQISFDEKVRVRPKSIHKELNKQVREAGKILRILKKDPNSIRLKRKAILFRLQQRMISMSVGRIKLTKKFKLNAHSNLNHFSWAEGFKVLKKYDIISSQLKTLDRNRELQLWRVRKKLNTLDKIDRLGNQAIRLNKNLRVPGYYGYDFSYYGQFDRGYIRKSNDALALDFAEGEG